MSGKATLGDAPGPPVRYEDTLSMTAKRRCIAGPSAQETADGKLLCDDFISVDTQWWDSGEASEPDAVSLAAQPGEVVSNTGKSKISKARTGQPWPVLLESEDTI